MPVSVTKVESGIKLEFSAKDLSLQYSNLHIGSDANYNVRNVCDKKIIKGSLNSISGTQRRYLTIYL